MCSIDHYQEWQNTGGFLQLKYMDVSTEIWENKSLTFKRLLINTKNKLMVTLWEGGWGMGKIGERN